MASIRWPYFHLHLPYMSNRYLASSPGQVTATLGTPEVRFSLDSSSIRILLNRVEKGRVAETIALKGQGIGAGLGVGITVPFLNASISTTDMPGVGTRLWQTPFSAPHMTAHDFKGVCWVTSGSHADVGAQASAVVLMFCDEASLYSGSPMSVNAVGAAVGVGIQPAIVSLGADVIGYTLNMAR